MRKRTLTLVAMSILCALLLGGVLYLRLNGADGLARAGILAASLAMAVVMVRLAGRADRGER